MAFRADAWHGISRTDRRLEEADTIALLDGSLSDRLCEMAPGLRNKASACLATKTPVARSKARLRFIFLLKALSFRSLYEEPTFKVRHAMV